MSLRPAPPSSALAVSGRWARRYPVTFCQRGAQQRREPLGVGRRDVAVVGVDDLVRDHRRAASSPCRTSWSDRSASRQLAVRPATSVVRWIIASSRVEGSVRDIEHACMLLMCLARQSGTEPTLLRVRRVFEVDDT